MAIIITGQGKRTAESYNGTSTAAPLLHIEYTSEPLPNRIPVAVDDSALTVVDTPTTVDVTTNDSDPDGNLDPTTANTDCATCAEPSNGILINEGAGSFTYTPNPGYVGSDGFTYQVCDTEGLCDTADVAITITSATPQTIEVRVMSSSDDAEESDTGRVSLTSSDLEMVNAGNRGDQTVGIRFAGLNLPQGATITKAWIQFQADETSSEVTNLVIEGHAVDNALTFIKSSYDISSRIRTSAQVTWTPPAWTTTGVAGPAQRTGDLTAIIQELVSRPGWAPGNAMAIIITGQGPGWAPGNAMAIIITGQGKRTAESYNGTSTAAPLLHIEYTAPASASASDSLRPAL
jgi:hypothetical protein